MLVLGIRLREEIIIDVPPSDKSQRVVVRLTDIDRYSEVNPWRAKLGFTAARQVTIHRRSVLERIEVSQKDDAAAAHWEQLFKEVSEESPTTGTGEP